MPELSDQFRDMMKGDESLALKAAELLTTKDKSLSLKTEINDALRLAIFGALSDYLDERGMKLSAKFLRNVSTQYQVFMVSYKRKSRAEVVEFIKEVWKQEKSMPERMFERR